MSNKTGGPAFPELGNVGHNTDWQSESGMTIRDYFAAKAMHGYISTAGGPCIIGGLDGAEDELAKQSYKMADAMLRAREAS
ncbi:hypothetical protein RJO21_001657 [Enterobacter hormaechei]|nr:MULTISPECIES: hypothetical protein [Enterobacter]ELC6389993.1 hypothetical protein [Enterobacter hormaechei]KLP75547.1 hypothetical protein ABF80_11010 [Enterobacter hormaechei subsp. steigerwaltii]KTI47646.1 hypothetical protein ASV03_09595 [Enterobacter hormaechei subsp. steigerwaltii]KUQ81702.1 hypothetical protein AWI27_05110 [Enterobacter hormaechei subsp. steigerwaltii]MCE1256913.1 hypothetical protein [Enterobacter hormaechei]